MLTTQRLEEIDALVANWESKEKEKVLAKVEYPTAGELDPLATLNLNNPHDVWTPEDLETLQSASREMGVSVEELKEWYARLSEVYGDK